MFVDGLDSIIKKVYKIGFMIVVCGNCSISYLSENDRRKQLHAVSFNLSSTVDLPTRIHNKSSTAIDNVFINIHFCNILNTLLVNGLSDRDAQLLTIDEVNVAKNKPH